MNRIKSRNLCSYVLIVILILLKTQLSISKLYPNETKTLSIYKNEGFLIYLKPDLSENKKQLKKCELEFNEIKYDLLPTGSQHTGQNNELIQKFDIDNLCGAQIHGVVTKSTGVWKLSSENIDGFTEDGSMTIELLEIKPELIAPDVINITTSSFTCPYDDNKIYCMVWDGWGQVYDGSCSMTSSGKINELSWTCKTLKWGRITTFDNKINMIDNAMNVNYLQRNIIETATSKVLSCATRNHAAFDNCVAIRPTNDVLLVREGLADKSYTTYDTNLLRGVCSIELKLPIADADYGLWRILDKRGSNGCVFLMESVPGKIQEKEIEKILLTKKQPIQIDVNTEQSNKTTIKCEFFTEIEYCFIQTPQKEITYLPQTEMYPSSGICKFNIEAEDGRWVCGIKPIEMNTIYEIHYEMNTYSKMLIKSNTKSVITKQNGDTVQLMCKTVLNYRISFCNFFAPNGDRFFLKKNGNDESTRYKYFGAGLEAGECGIEISQLKDGDYGTWSCSVLVINRDNGKAHSLKFQLEQAVISTSTAIGLSAGAACLVLIILGIVIVHYRRKIRMSRETENLPVNVEYTNNQYHS